MIRFNDLLWELVKKSDDTLHVEARVYPSDMPCGIVMFDEKTVLHKRTGINFDVNFPYGEDNTILEGDYI